MVSEVNRQVRQDSSATTAKATARRITWQRMGLYAALALGFFLLGAIPMWLKAHESASQREAAQHELRLSHLENSLSGAVIDARRGDYEPARQTASDFFTALRGQMDRGAESDLTTAQRESLGPLLTQRDNIITLLARSDPAAADRLSDLYINYRKAMSNVQPQNKN
ncbi:MAG: hypothetical protein WCB68_19060 [Pyrinomonadaceae bacterium]